ncbi:helix-turn-helix domain-containing protein [Roseiconus lacunae]|uniref:helix-turn-helix domain-containing protein n=1 Tax=Roseiconus lacunae TaxID=2605694 RepID=UPI0033145380
MTRRYDIKQTAERLGCKRDHVNHLIEAGELPAIDISVGKVRKRWTIAVSDIEAFEQRRASGGKPKRSPRVAPANETRQWV